MFKIQASLFKNRMRHTLILISYSKYRFKSLKQKCWWLIFLAMYAEKSSVYPGKAMQGAVYTGSVDTVLYLTLNNGQEM